MTEFRRVLFRSPEPLVVLRERAGSALSTFDSTYLRFLNPHVYKVSISEGLRGLKLGFVERYRS